MPTAKWSDRPETETDLPPIPWKSTHSRLNLSLSAFLAPLDRATEFYLNVLWDDQVSRALAQSRANQGARELRSILKPLDVATEIYLEHYWAALKKECIVASELRAALRPLDLATETYLEQYWSGLKMECIANST